MAEENKKQEDKDTGNKKKADEKKAEVAEAPKKTSAIVKGSDLKISTKHSIDICKMIRGKTIENALQMLEEVLRYKRVVKMNTREVGHKPGKGVMAGRYPQKACSEFIRLLKQLNANAIVNELEPSDSVIFCKADIASRPYRRQGHRFKRTHVLLKLEPRKKKEKKGGKK